MSIVDAGRSTWRAAHASMSRVVEYEPHGGAPTFTINAFIRGLRADDLFGSALQTDIVGIISADDFALAMPARPRPLRYDRIHHQPGPGGLRFSVEEWRGAPHDAAPVFFKLLLRGGDQ